MTSAKFDLGQVVYTQGFRGAVGEDFNQVVSDLVLRHVSGDWGDLCEEDRRENDHAIIPGNDLRVMSKYDVNGEDVYVITEWDRSVTTLLLPCEY
tara:strand:+ start:622 stop:906 length:285 start_codon:yes stop_codon:yes gene_type:complete